MFFCEICEIKIQINNHFEKIKNMSKDYIIAPCAPELILEATDTDIKKELSLYPDLPEDYHEAVVLFRQLSEKVIECGVFFLHSAAVALDGAAYLFCGKSGAGKSTHARLWCELYPSARIINADKPLIRLKEDGFYVYGTPWCGIEAKQTNTSAPIKAVCFIEQSSENAVRPMPAHEVIGKIFNQTVYQKEKSANEQLSVLLDKFITDIPFFLLKCNISPDAVQTAQRAMNGEKI